jgi:Nidogen-like
LIAFLSTPFLLMNLTRLLLAIIAISGVLCGQVPNPLSISPTIPGQFQLSWLAANQRPYQIEAGPDLVVWAELGPVVVGNGFIQGMLVSASAPKFFYRLREGAMRPGFDAIAMGREDDHSYDLPDGPVSEVPIGFPVKFYGEIFTTCYVNNNGNITFDGSLSTWDPVTFATAPQKMIAPFWADVDTRSAGSNVVRFSNNETSVDIVDGKSAFGVTYRDVGYYNRHADKLNSFQVILISRSDIGYGDFDIEFNYNQIQWDSGDLSFSNPARVGIANRSELYIQYEGSGQASVFLDEVPATGEPNYESGLKYESFNSGIPGRIVFPVRNGQVVGGFLVNAGVDQVPSQDSGGRFELQGSINPPGLGGVTYLWSMVNGPADVVFSDSSSLATDVVLSVPGDYEFQLFASKDDNLAVTHFDTMIINHPGVYNVFAGNEIDAESAVLSLDEAVATAPPGVMLSVHWTQEEGEPVVFSDPNALNPTINLPGAGSFLFLMTATTDHVDPFTFTSYIRVDFDD